MRIRIQLNGEDIYCDDNCGVRCAVCGQFISWHRRGITCGLRSFMSMPECTMSE
jgi:hypothetical protein